MPNYELRMPDGRAFQLQVPDGWTEDQIRQKAVGAKDQYLSSGKTKFDTQLGPDEETAFQEWKAKNAPKDSGVDYDLRGAFKAGLTPDAKTGHWPDTYKKPNHPTFSDQSQYAKDALDKAGRWEGDKFVPQGQRKPAEIQGPPRPEETPMEEFTGVRLLGGPQPVQPEAAPQGPPAPTVPQTAPGSPERKAALDREYARVQAEDRQKSIDNPPGINIPLLGKQTSIFSPAGGATLAAIASGERAPGMRTQSPAAALGGAAGTIADEAMRLVAGLPAPSMSEVANRSLSEAKKQGLAQLGGEGIMAAGRSGLGAGSSEATRRVMPHLEGPITAPEQSAVARGTAYQHTTEDLLNRGRQVYQPLYDQLEQQAAQSGARVVPRQLMRGTITWQRDLNRGLGGNAPSQGWVDRFQEKFRNTGGQIPVTDMLQIRKELNAAIEHGDLTPDVDTHRLIQMRGALDRDLATIPDPQLHALHQQARDAFVTYRVPFEKGEGRVLHQLLDKSPEQYDQFFSSSKAPQAVRELRQVAALHPQVGQAALDDLRANTAQAVLEKSRVPGITGQRVDGQKLYNVARDRREVLNELYYPEFSRDLQAVARRVMVGQAAGKPNMATLGGAGGLLYYHPVTGVPIILGAAALPGFFGSPTGMRVLSEGILPRTQAALASQTIRNVGAAAIRGRMNGTETPEQKDAIVQKAIGPIGMKQIAVQQKGPEGQPAIAQIGGKQSVYDPLIAASTENSGVSPQLAKALFTTESAMNPKATSPVGAQGIAQFMPATAAGVGLRDPYDPTEAIPAAVQHMGNLLQKYQGNKELALAAYNAGEPAVDRFGGVPPYKETQDYVRKVLANEQDFLQDRRRMETTAKDQQEGKKDLSWNEISTLFQKASSTKDPEAYKQIRVAINRRVNRSSGDRMFGLSPQQYKKFYPLIAQALKPEPSELAMESLGSGGLGG